MVLQMIVVVVGVLLKDFFRRKAHKKISKLTSSSGLREAGKNLRSNEIVANPSFKDAVCFVQLSVLREFFGC